MYQRVLAAVNEYANSEMAARYAIVLSKSCGAKLLLVFVAEGGADRETFKRAEAAMERLFIQARDHGVEVESVTETGDPYRKIQGLVKREEVDLAFTGTRHADQKRRFFQKSHARELVIGLRCSVAMVRVVRMARTHPKNILVPLRGQMSSIEERSCFVAELAKGFKADVTLFHAARPMTTLFRGETLLASAEREKQTPPDVEQFAHCLKRHGIRHEIRTSYGKVSRAITIEAAHRKNDLIVMGASERGLLKSMISSDPVEEVLRETPCNLIIFRPHRRHHDAPALKKADIGIAMGQTGTDVAKEAADVVLLDDNFATILNAVEEGRTIFENIRKFITYIFAHGTPEAVPYVLFALANIPLPLTVMQILAIDLGTETIPALALGVERGEADIMRRPPRPLGRGLIDCGLLFRGYVFIGFISAVGVLAGYFYVLFQGEWHWGVSLPDHAELARQATTATFLGIVILQVGNVFACRSATDSIFRLGFLSNRLVLAGIGFELLLAAFIIYTPLGHSIFSTAPLGLDVWFVLLPFSAALLAAEEARKAYLRRVAGGAP